MAITVRRTTSVDYGKWMKLLVCGEPGAGKTLFASTFPNVLYASAEGGLMSVAERDVLTVEIKESGQLHELRLALDQKPEVRAKMIGSMLGQGPTPVDTVVIDTVDEVARIIQKERLSAEKKEALAQADWGWYGENLRSILRTYRNLEMNVIFTCHVKTTEDSESGAVLVNPAIQGAVGDEIAAYVDLALLIQARPTTTVVDNSPVRSLVRYMQTFPDGRHRWIKDRSGKLPMEFPIDFETDYKRLEAAIYGGMPDTQVQPVTVPAPQPVTAPETPAPTPEPEPVAAPEPAPVVEPEPVAPAPEPEPQPTPEPAPEVEPAPAVSSEEPAPVAAAAGGLVCENCSGAIETEDQRDLSRIRFRADLCRKCFTDRKTKK